MYARLLALVCLLTSSAFAGNGDVTTAGPLNLYLKSEGGASPAAILEMKSELASLMKDVGLQVDWWSPKDRVSGIDGDLVVVDLRGVCTLRHADALEFPKNLPPLASTAVADGHVLPFTWVDCAALSRFVASSLIPLPATQREFYYGRSLARLVAHEIYHVVTSTTQHESAGVAKAQFTLQELTGEHFEFSARSSWKSRQFPGSRAVDPDSPGWPVLEDLNSSK